MKRIALSNENEESTGSWFDLSKAKEYQENEYWNGTNNISCATGSQWEHEYVYVTPSGKFILNKFSNYQGTRETYELISKEDAAKWFAKQSFEDDEIPSVFHAEVAKLEIT